MNNDVSNIEARMKRYFPKGPDNSPDRDHIQRKLTIDFIAALQNRGDKTPDEVTKQFGIDRSGVLVWLGDRRQDMILIDAMMMTGIDLSHWLEESEKE